MTGPVATIDGRSVDFEPGEPILDAAERAGIPVPTLCHDPSFAPEGGCRLCVVQVEGAERLVASCHTAIERDMRIHTDSEPVEAARREILSLYLSSVPEGTFEPGADSRHAFERLLARYGFPEAPVAPLRVVDEQPAYLRFEPARCIMCRRCVHTCEQIQGQFVFSVEQRGAETRLGFGGARGPADSACVECGACVDHCPTGALSDRDRLDPAMTTRTTQSVCGYCGVGCRVEIETDEERVLRIGGVGDSEVNRGHLCVKGRYAHGWQRSEDRLTRPHLLLDGSLEPVSWSHAIDWLAARLGELRVAHGGGAFGAMTSSRSTNESAYLLQKLARVSMGTNNVDCCARVCHSSTALALRTLTGTGAASASYRDIESARCIVVAGANPTAAHPVVGARIKQAALRGTPLLVFDPRAIELARYARVHLALRPGTNVALHNALAKLLLEDAACDDAYLAERTEGVDALRESLSGRPLDALASECGLDADALREAAALLASGPVLFVHGLGLSELVQGTASVMTLCNLALLTGSVGREGAGLLPLRGQNNVQGNADMGGMPNLVTGYQALDDPEVRARLESTWGKAPPSEPGWTSGEMLDAAVRGELRGLWVQGEDLVQSEPHEAHVLDALDRLELLVVQDLFWTATARRAHLVLPAAGWLEQDGTFTSGERRIQRVRAAVAPPGEARPDWEVVRDVARALGESWDYAHPRDVMDEVARVVPQLFGGIRYARLENDGLQWPCPTPDHPGTAVVHSAGFTRGRGRLAVVDFSPSPESDVAGFPYALITGRVLEHYNVGTMTRRTANAALVGCDSLEIHPDDAKRESIDHGAPVSLESRWGKTTATARYSHAVARGTLFLSFHFPETHANRLTGPHADPDSRCPQYKLTAVRIERTPHP